MLDSLESYIKTAGHFMYLGGNGFYWVTSLDPNRPYIAEVRKWVYHRPDTLGEYYHSTTGELGGTWKNRGRAPQKIVGVGFTAEGYDRNSYYERMPDSFSQKANFIFEGVGKEEHIGNFDSLLMHFGAAGDEIDRLDFVLGTPFGALLLASAREFTRSYQPISTDVVLEVDKKYRKLSKDLVRADIVYMDYPNGGKVFSVGSMSWCGCLSHNGYNNNVSQITSNVLHNFSAI